MKYLLFIALGGASGAMLRYEMTNWIHSWTEHSFPLGTLWVNVSGSFFMGILYVLIAEKMTLHPDWRSVLMVGLLGAFTTFSTFSLETIHLLENGQTVLALSYILLSVALCLLAVWGAMGLMRLF